MTKIRTGFTKLIEQTNKMTFAVKGSKTETKYIGTWKGREYKASQDKKKMEPGILLELGDTIYMPSLVVNLFSVNQVRKKGAILFDRDGFFGLKIGEQELIFNVPLTSKLGYVLGTYIKPIGIEPESQEHRQKKMNINNLHKILGHLGERYVRETAKLLGIQLNKGVMETCTACVEGKQKQKHIKPIILEKESQPGQRFGMDISYCQHESIGGRRFWCIWIDYATSYIWSMFFKIKSELEVKVCQFLKDRLKEFNEQLIFVRCDGAGENKGLADKAREENRNVKFEFTAPGTPQQNGKAERMIATIWGKLRTTMIWSELSMLIKNKLWAEVVITLSQIQNILSQTDKQENAKQQLYGYMPNWTRSLRTVGEMAGIRVYGVKGKMDKRGELAMLIGYHHQGLEECYRFYKINTGKIVHSRDVIWYNLSYGQYKINIMKDKNTDQSIEESSEKEINEQSSIPGLIEINEIEQEDNKSTDIGSVLPMGTETEEVKAKQNTDTSESGDISELYPIPDLDKEQELYDDIGIREQMSTFTQSTTKRRGNNNKFLEGVKTRSMMKKSHEERNMEWELNG